MNGAAKREATRDEVFAIVAGEFEQVYTKRNSANTVSNHNLGRQQNNSVWGKVGQHVIIHK